MIDPAIDTRAARAGTCDPRRRLFCPRRMLIYAHLAAWVLSESFRLYHAITFRLTGDYFYYQKYPAMCRSLEALSIAAGMSFPIFPILMAIAQRGACVPAGERKVLWLVTGLLCVLQCFALLPSVQ